MCGCSTCSSLSDTTPLRTAGPLLARCQRPLPPTLRLALRVILRWRAEGAGETSQDPLAEPGPGSYTLFESLSHHWERLSDSRKQIFATMAAMLTSEVLRKGAGEIVPSCCLFVPKRGLNKHCGKRRGRRLDPGREVNGLHARALRRQQPYPGGR